MSLAILSARSYSLTRTRSSLDVLWSIWVPMLSSGPLPGKQFTLVKLQTRIATRSRRWPHMIKHQCIRSPRMGICRSLLWKSISSTVSNTRPHPLSYHSTFPRHYSKHNNFLNRRGLTGNPEGLAWLILDLSTIQIRRFDDQPIGRAKDRVVVMPHQDTTRETQVFPPVLVLHRPKTTSIRLHRRPSSTFCPLEPPLLSLAANTDRNDCNERRHVDNSSRCRRCLLVCVCIYTYDQNNGRFRLVSTPHLILIPWPSSRGLLHPSLILLPSSLSSIQLPCRPLSRKPSSHFVTPTDWLLDSLPVGLHLRNGHSSWRFPSQDVVHYYLKNVVTTHVIGLG